MVHKQVNFKNTVWNILSLWITQYTKKKSGLKSWLQDIQVTQFLLKDTRERR